MKIDKLLEMKKCLTRLFKSFVWAWIVFVGTICVLGYVSRAIKEKVTWNIFMHSFSEFLCLFKEHFNIIKFLLNMAPVYIVVTTSILLLVFLYKPVNVHKKTSKKKAVIITLLFVPCLSVCLPFALIIDWGLHYAFSSNFSTIYLKFTLIMMLLTGFYLGMLFLCYLIDERSLKDNPIEINLQKSADK